MKLIPALVGIEREMFQFVFFNENETTNVWLFWNDLGCQEIKFPG